MRRLCSLFFTASGTPATIRMSAMQQIAMRNFSTARGRCVLLPMPTASMTPSDFRDVLRLLDSALHLFRRGRFEHPASLQRELRAVSLELDLFRVRRRQPATTLQRN